MTHLTEHEIVDFIDGTLPEDRARHAAECHDCGAQIEGLRGVLGRAAEVGIPEPSPLFWEHFSARVRAHIDEVGHEGSSWWSKEGVLGWKWIVSGALAVLVVMGAWRMAIPTAPQVNRPTPGSVAPATDISSADARTDDLSWLDAAADTDEAWALVRSVADEIEWDEDVTAGLAVRPGWAERAAAGLSRAEVDELVRLLEAEVKRPGA